MKKGKKMTAVLLSLAMTVSGVALTNPTSASAAKKVSLSTKKLAVRVGQSKKLKLKNNKKKVTWKVISGKKNITLKSKKKTGVSVVGKKKGTAKVQAKVGKKKYSCKVTVKAKKTTQTAKTPASAVTDQPTKAPTDMTQPTGTTTAVPTTTASAEPTETSSPIATVTAKPTALPVSIVNGVLQLYYNDKNANQVIAQIDNSEIPVHVIVEDSVTNIKNGAFRDCSGLNNIVWNGNTYASIKGFLSAFKSSKE